MEPGVESAPLRECAGGCGSPALAVLVGVDGDVPEHTDCERVEFVLNGRRGRFGTPTGAGAAHGGKSDDGGDYADDCYDELHAFPPVLLHEIFRSDGGRCIPSGSGVGLLASRSPGIEREIFPAKRESTRMTCAWAGYLRWGGEEVARG